MMSPQDWVLALEIAEDAARLPLNERVAFTHARCAGREDLLDAVRQIQSAPVDDRPDVLLADHLDELAMQLFRDEERDPQPGEMIGPYVLGPAIGRGGMGRVYHAVHATHGGPVALKLLDSRPGGGRTMTGRLLHEARILARCQHPAIVHIHHADVLPDGRAYFTMERVEGLPVTDFCVEQRLGVQERLRLFLLVCEAVAVAHTAGVVHRDLKPSNILANAQGVKLLDFGVAAAYGTDDQPLHYMSAAYAAPEHGVEANERCDVYSLGIVLTEMLTGCLPFEGETPSRRRQAMLDDAFRPPSALAAARPSATLGPVSRFRWRELDAVASRCIARNPEDRYERVEQLASDLRRLLRREPVSARSSSKLAPSFLYVSQCFCRRHTIQFTVGCGALLALGLLLADHSRLLHTSRQMTAEKTRATEQQMKQWMVIAGLFNNDDGSINTQANKDGVLERGIHQVEVATSDPDQRAAAYHTFGAQYQMAGNYARADQLFKSAFQLESDAHGIDSPEAADVQLQQADLLVTESKPQEGLKLAQAARTTLLKRLPPSDLRVLQADIMIAEGMTHTAEYEPADTILKNAVNVLRRTPDGRHDLSTAINDLADVEDYLGHYPESLKLQQESLEMDKVDEGPMHPDIAEHLLTISNLYELMGDFPRATDAAREALRILTVSLPPGHHDVASAEKQLGICLVNQKKYSEAEPHFTRALQTLHAEKERSRTEVATELNYGDLLRKEHKLDDALVHYRRSLELAQQMYTKPETIWATAYFGIAATEYLSDRQTEAEDAALKTAALNERFFGSSHVRTLQADVLLSHVYIKERKFAEARTMLERCEQLAANATNKDAALQQVLSEERELAKRLPKT